MVLAGEAVIMTLTVLIASYGYYALFVGTFLEGVTIQAWCLA